MTSINNSIQTRVFSAPTATPSLANVGTSSPPQTNQVSTSTTDYDAIIKQARFDFEFWETHYNNLKKSTEEKYGANALYKQIKKESDPAKKAELQKKYDEILNDPNYIECCRLIGEYYSRMESAHATIEWAKRMKAQQEQTGTPNVPTITAMAPTVTTPAVSPYNISSPTAS